MFKKLLIFMMAMASGSLLAMKPQRNDLNEKLLQAIARAPYEQIQDLLNQGADANATNKTVEGKTVLHLAIQDRRPSEIIKLLIEHGAQTNARTVFTNKLTVLHLAAINGSLPYVRALLFTIPLAEQQKMQKEYDGLVAGAIAVFRGQPQPNKDIRKLIAKLYTQPLIDRLVAEQMQKIEHLIGIKANDGRTALNFARSQGNQVPESESIIALLDPNNLASREAIRKEVERNIRHILFGPRVHQANITAQSAGETRATEPMDTKD